MFEGERKLDRALLGALWRDTTKPNNNNNEDDNKYQTLSLRGSRAKTQLGLLSWGVFSRGSRNCFDCSRLPSS